MRAGTSITEGTVNFLANRRRNKCGGLHAVPTCWRRSALRSATRAGHRPLPRPPASTTGDRCSRPRVIPAQSPNCSTSAQWRAPGTAVRRPCRHRPGPPSGDRGLAYIRPWLGPAEWLPPVARYSRCLVLQTLDHAPLHALRQEDDSVRCRPCLPDRPRRSVASMPGDESLSIKPGTPEHRLRGGDKKP